MLFIFSFIWSFIRFCHMSLMWSTQTNCFVTKCTYFLWCFVAFVLLHSVVAHYSSSDVSLLCYNTNRMRHIEEKTALLGEKSNTDRFVSRWRHSPIKRPLLYLRFFFFEIPSWQQTYEHTTPAFLIGYVAVRVIRFRDIPLRCALNIWSLNSDMHST